jgi:glycosyltransferase involved in cell wall biosynthesis
MRRGPVRAPVESSLDWSHALVKTAFVSTYAPHRCGIATFTSDLASSVGPHQVVALHPVSGPAVYPSVVRHRIRRDARADYLVAADALNASDVDTVSIQHEYGIWGGEDGAYVLDFVRALRVPVVTTLHTVLRTPTPSQRRILAQLVGMSATTVVMSDAAASLLTQAYGVEPGRVRIVPHGVPRLPLVDPDTVKPRLGLDGRLVVLSFGLLGPGKGYEAVIAAMPAVVEANPTVLYVILGATHPDLLLHEGEAYRRRLEAMAEALHVTDHVRFVDRFVGRSELGTWLEAADIFVTPYPNLDQIVSGTLSYAMGAGKAVVSTPYAYARERLAGGRGRLVAPGSTQAIADALVDLLGDRDGREALGRRAYDYSRGMTWSAVGSEYARIFAGAGRTPVAVMHPAVGLAVAGG